MCGASWSKPRTDSWFTGPYFDSTYLIINDPGLTPFDWKPSIIAGVLAGYVVYSYVLHHGVTGASLRDLHVRHQQRPDRNLGVTTLLRNRLFGTLDRGVALLR